MFITKKHLDRRTFLRGAFGTAIALPLLDAMVPAATAQTRTAAAERLRFGAIYMPNGVYPGTWHPTKVGKDFEFNRTMKPLEPFRNYLTTISKLKAPEGKKDMGGIHMGASAAFLNGRGPVGHNGDFNLIESKKSIDQSIEDALPYEPRKRVRDDIPVGVYDVIADFGQARGTNTATILPNDALFSRRYGRTILLRANIMKNPVLFAADERVWRAATADAHRRGVEMTKGKVEAAGSTLGPAAAGRSTGLGTFVGGREQACRLVVRVGNLVTCQRGWSRDRAGVVAGGGALAADQSATAQCLAEVVQSTAPQQPVGDQPEQHGTDNTGPGFSRHTEQQSADHGRGNVQPVEQRDPLAELEADEIEDRGQAEGLEQVELQLKHGCPW